VLILVIALKFNLSTKEKKGKLILL